MTPSDAPIVLETPSASKNTQSVDEQTTHEPTPRPRTRGRTVSVRALARQGGLRAEIDVHSLPPQSQGLQTEDNARVLESQLLQSETQQTDSNTCRKCDASIPKDSKLCITVEEQGVETYIRVCDSCSKAECLRLAALDDEEEKARTSARLEELRQDEEADAFHEACRSSSSSASSSSSFSSEDVTSTRRQRIAEEELLQLSTDEQMVDLAIKKATTATTRYGMVISMMVLTISPIL